MSLRELTLALSAVSIIMHISVGRVLYTISARHPVRNCNILQCSENCTSCLLAANLSFSVVHRPAVNCEYYRILVAIPNAAIRKILHMLLHSACLELGGILRGANSNFGSHPKELQMSHWLCGHQKLISSKITTLVYHLRKIYGWDGLSKCVTCDGGSISFWRPFLDPQLFCLYGTPQYGLRNFCLFVFVRTPVSARSYRASVFLLDYVLCCHCQANKLIHSICITPKFGPIHYSISFYKLCNVHNISNQKNLSQKPPIYCITTRWGPPQNATFNNYQSTIFDASTNSTISTKWSWWLRYGEFLVGWVFSQMVIHCVTKNTPNFLAVSHESIVEFS